MADKKPEQAPSETLRVDGRRLAPLFPEAMKGLGEKEGYLQNLELVWTRGKNHPVWESVNAEEVVALEGEVVDAEERAQVRNFYARVALDFGVHEKSPAQSLIGGRTGGASAANWSKLSLSQLRQRCLRAVFHEYAHALQQWRIGAKQSPNAWGLSKAEQDYTSTLAAYQRAFAAQGKSAQEAYMATPAEVDARKLADEALVRVSGELEGGKWDFLLPAKLIEAYTAGK